MRIKKQMGKWIVPQYHYKGAEAAQMASMLPPRLTLLFAGASTFV
ncbi:MAG TPA: hypothetical protein PKE68_06935 [Saprospiraceae bacterium]|nr:hypothetical protein [Saprospiraceae bacterium]